MKKTWLSYSQAQRVVQQLGIESSKHWKRLCAEGKRPDNIPAKPEDVYKDTGWSTWGDFLGTGSMPTSRHKFCPYEEAKKYAQSLGLKSSAEWRQHVSSGKAPKDIPSHVDAVYKEHWVSWGEFLGTGNIAASRREFLPYEEAKTFLATFNFSSTKAFKAWASSGQRPLNIPSNPHTTYKNSGWKGYRDFLGLQSRSQQRYLPYSEAKAIIRKLGFETSTDFNQWVANGSKPDNIPARPYRVYANEGWTDWADFIGVETTRKKSAKFLSFNKARDYVKKLGLTCNREYREWARSGKRPDFIPSDPATFYKDKGFVHMADFCGFPYRGNCARTPPDSMWMTLEEARDLMLTMHFGSKKEFEAWAKSGKRPKNLPEKPDVVYSGYGWEGWDDFLYLNKRSGLAGLVRQLTAQVM